MQCEVCRNDLPYEFDDDIDTGANAARARRAGVHVKNFAILGDQTGFHYFCSPVCGRAYLDQQTHEM